MRLKRRKTLEILKFADADKNLITWHYSIASLATMRTLILHILFMALIITQAWKIKRFCVHIL